jgi:hypothetical protein
MTQNWMMTKSRNGAMSIPNAMPRIWNESLGVNEGIIYEESSIVQL